MKTEGTNLHVLTISAFWSSYVVAIDRFHCMNAITFR